MNFFLNEMYKNLTKAKTIKDYITNSKDKYLSEEIWKIELDLATQNYREITEKIKSYK